MNKIFKIGKNWLLGALFLSIAASSCKKDPVAVDPDPTKPATGTRDELTKDSLFLYAKDVYFWNEALPSYESFAPRSINTFDAVVDKISNYKLNPKFNASDPNNTNQYIDKYSFLDDGSLSAELGGQGGDYGFSVFYNVNNDLRVKYAYPNSPATAAGLKRGYQITKVNGRTNLDFNASGTLDFLNNSFFGDASSVSITVKKPDGSSADVVVQRGGYSINPIITSKVIDLGSKKVGYMVYNSFTTDTTRIGTTLANFASSGINELVIDLRYNGGGSVATADYFIRRIAPATQDNNTMYTTIWTKKMQDDQANILQFQPLLDGNGKLQPFTGGINKKYATYFDIDYSVAANTEKFKKSGSLNVSRIYFLVTKGTASASELLINTLSPVMDVKLIGKRSYGKPVGFYGITIDKNKELYTPMFQTKNQKNEGDYFDGLPVNKDLNDDVTKDFGDPTEAYLAAALGYAQTGAFAIGNPKNNLLSSLSPLAKQRLDEAGDKLKNEGVKDMIFDRKLKLKKK